MPPISRGFQAPVRWTWEELLALPAEKPTVDIHCVTVWSKFDTTWKGVSVDTLLAEVETEAEHVRAWCDGGYTTNLPLEDVTGGRAWIAYEFDGEPLDPSHGGQRGCSFPTSTSGRARKEQRYEGD
jgi:DMSO/TMAO reductase YedYZ molybdopterin-dependent catalytic subunit